MILKTSISFLPNYASKAANRPAKPATPTAPIFCAPLVPVAAAALEDAVPDVLVPVDAAPDGEAVVSLPEGVLLPLSAGTALASPRTPP
jgi:hypothetical protein